MFILSQRNHGLMSVDGAKRLRELGQYDDLKYCLEENVKDIVPRCIKTSDGLKIIEA